MALTLRLLRPALKPLLELSLDLRWTWCHTADRLWHSIDPERWVRTRNPWLILHSVSESRFAELEQNTEFLAELQRLVALREQYLGGPTWFSTNVEQGDFVVAYFSMEYGLGEALPIYAGGLGVLAGDHLKTASDLGVPIVAVGLLYQQGYFRQMLDARGWQRELFPINVPSTLPVQPVVDATGAQLYIPVELPGRILRLQVWLAQVGRVPLYLLDSNDPLNSPADRGITSQLYRGGTEMRLTQEFVLGVGGWRALRALNIQPSVCHLNEGHAAFAAMERARQFSEVNRLSFLEALWATRPGNVFTTHTPLGTAFDTFPVSLLAQYGTGYAQLLSISPRELIGLGRRNANDDSEPFNLAYFAARVCGWVNGVSQLHGKVSQRIFQPLFPRWPASEVPIAHITNGVHVPSWDSPWADKLWTGACGKQRWLGSVDALSNEIAALSDEALWAVRAQERQDLIAYARTRLAQQLGYQGANASTIAAALNVLDPNVLTLGFARRFTEYKRMDLLLRDADRFARLLTNPVHPVQVIVGGKAHPRDERGKEHIRAWAQFVKRPDVRVHAVFLEDYDITLAQEMVQGVDLWINTPRRPWEACGTSGMKILVNGGLNLSVLDGWWAEAYAPEFGWAIGDGQDSPDRDDLEAQELYRLLEQEIIPTFYDRDQRGIPTHWVKRMRASMSTLAPRFSTNRMMAQYVREAYCPGASELAARCAQDGRLARELASLEARLRQHWHEVRLSNFQQAATAQGFEFTVHAFLGDIAPEHVQVQLYAEPAGEGTSFVRSMQLAKAIPGVTNGYVYAATVQTSRPPSHFTPRIIAHHPHAKIPGEINLIHWLP